MEASEALSLFVNIIHFSPDAHMLFWFAECASKGIIHPFTFGLCAALADIDTAVPGYAKEMLCRIARVAGTGEDQYEALDPVVLRCVLTECRCGRS